MKFICILACAVRGGDKATEDEVLVSLLLHYLADAPDVCPIRFSHAVVLRLISLLCEANSSAVLQQGRKTTHPSDLVNTFVDNFWHVRVSTSPRNFVVSYQVLCLGFVGSACGRLRRVLQYCLRIA